jgi:ribosomal protein S18
MPRPAIITDRTDTVQGTIRRIIGRKHGNKGRVEYVAAADIIRRSISEKKRVSPSRAQGAPEQAQKAGREPRRIEAPGLWSVAYSIDGLIV